MAEPDWWIDDPEPSVEPVVELPIDLASPATPKLDAPPRKRRKLPIWVTETCLYGAAVLPGDDFSLMLHMFWQWDVPLSFNFYPAAVAKGGLWKSDRVLLDWLKDTDFYEWASVILQ